MNVAIFPGHIGKDSGAVDKKYSHDKDNIYSIESSINNAIAAYLDVFLSQMDIKHKIITGSLQHKVEKSKECNLGISIHCDWNENPNTKGLHTIHYPGSKYGKEFAKYISNNPILIENLSVARRPHSRNDLYILKNTKFPIVLLESGFLSNTEQEKKLNTPVIQKRIAFALANSIQKMKLIL